MTDEEKWAAVSQNDASYDGIFFCAVKSTGIYCRPSCKSKTPNRENVLYFDTVEQARSFNFRPCKRCRPDLLDYQPSREIGDKARRMIDGLFHEKCELNAQLRHIGVTQHRLVKIFKEQYEVSLFEYINGLRLAEAKRLLAETDDEIINVAYGVGFGSLSAFYRFFKKNTASSPSANRKQVKANAPQSANNYAGL